MPPASCIHDVSSSGQVPTKVDLSRLLVVLRRGLDDPESHEIVTWQGRPQFPFKHLGALAAKMPGIEMRFDRADIEFGVPSILLQFRSYFFRTLPEFCGSSVEGFGLGADDDTPRLDKHRRHDLDLRLRGCVFDTIQK